MKYRKKYKKVLQGFSLRRSQDFLPNLVLAIGVVFVWRGVRNLIDKYLFPGHEDLSFFVSIFIGVLLIYLPDKSLKYLGNYDGEEDEC